MQILLFGIYLIIVSHVFIFLFEFFIWVVFSITINILVGDNFLMVVMHYITHSLFGWLIVFAGSTVGVFSHIIQEGCGVVFTVAELTYQ